ncbi:MAG: FKBP-type peptidyl-prolyl cis-trans isomerase [Polaribacter sp.]|nr:FKBP-type peptidyl-prolyl cis-trans isomerase [Polaribacter sp.]MDG1811366.1 FKBP-type peptidyl-prolyl cis-trans isomerase [Polaribacter sp.]MDG1994201.1 FKBP-type peptidyl-prolyl cis-trans isomerase [Polaribacter sp.]
MKPYLVLFLMIFFISCSNDEDNYSTENDLEIQEYIKRNNLNATKTASGLYIVITDQGNGAKPTSSSSVTVNYKGYFTDGSRFDQGQNVTFNLNQVITGWSEGLTHFNEDTQGWLLVPSHLGYGSNGSNSIPGGSVLIFSIHLLKIN